VLDPTSNAYTEINEWGPEVGDEELDMLSDKLSYLTQSAEFVVFSGSLPRDVQPDVYADLIREANRRHLLTVLDAEGEALRLGIKAEPYLVTPNMREAESLVGREFVDDADLASGLDEIAALGARNVIITLETGCYALLREDRTEIRVRATAPPVEPISGVGAGDTLLAGFISARAAGKPFDDAIKIAVGAGAASVLEAGAGRVDPREASRLAGLVAVDRLDPVAQEG
jgi:1-phosphofructokinase family hexose kinase